MKLTFWGTRGSSPTSFTHERAIEFVDNLVSKAQKAGIKELSQLVPACKDGTLGTPLSWGAHTPCVEFSDKDNSIFFDMGTGFREAGAKYFGKKKEFHVFMTHFHWDHLMGLPFFVPAFVPDHTIHIYHVHKNAPEMLKILFNGKNFPVTWDQLGADIQFHQINLYEPVKVHDATLTPFALDHPGGSFGYRLEQGGKAVVVGFDGEYKRNTREDLGKDLPYYQNLDLLIFDAQYDLDELITKYDWGHCSAPIGVDLALRENIGNLVLLHHDPFATDEKLRKSFTNIQRYAKKAQVQYPENWPESGPDLNVMTAYDGLEIDLNKL